MMRHMCPTLRSRSATDVPMSPQCGVLEFENEEQAASSLVCG